MGVATPMLSAVQEVNHTQRMNAVRRLRARLGTLEGKPIAVWGLTFKGGTEDTRESPAVDVIHLLHNEGADRPGLRPGVVDIRPVPPRPSAAPSPVGARGRRGRRRTGDPVRLAGIREVPLAVVRAAMRGRVLFDGRNVLSRDDAEALGFAYIGVGRVARTADQSRSRRDEGPGRWRRRVHRQPRLPGAAPRGHQVVVRR